MDENIKKVAEKYGIGKELDLTIKIQDLIMEKTWIPNWSHMNKGDISKCFDCSSFIKNPTIVFEFKRILELDPLPLSKKER